MTDFTENAALPESAKSGYSKSSIQTEIKSTFQFVFVLRDTEEPEFLDWVDFGVVTFSVGTVIYDIIVGGSCRVGRRFHEQCVAVCCCSVLQCVVAVCCSVLQRVAASLS